MKTHYYTSFVGGGCTIQGDAIVKERAVKAVVMGVFAREQYTMVILNREGRKKFGFASKPN